MSQVEINHPCPETSEERTLAEERSTKFLQPVIFHLPSWCWCWWQDKPSKAFPAPFLCKILVEAETHTAKKGRRERERLLWEKARRLVVLHLLVHVLSSAGLEKGRSFDLKHNYFITTHIQTALMTEMKLFGRWKLPEIFSRGSRINSPRRCSCIFYAGKKGQQKIYITELVGKYLQLSRQKTYNDSHYASSQALLRVDIQRQKQRQRDKERQRKTEKKGEERRGKKWNISFYFIHFIFILNKC